MLSCWYAIIVQTRSTAPRPHELLGLVVLALLCLCGRLEVIVPPCPPSSASPSAARRLHRLYQAQPPPPPPARSPAHQLCTQQALRPAPSPPPQHLAPTTPPPPRHHHTAPFALEAEGSPPTTDPLHIRRASRGSAAGSRRLVVRRRARCRANRSLTSRRIAMTSKAAWSASMPRLVAVPRGDGFLILQVLDCCHSEPCTCSEASG